MPYEERLRQLVLPERQTIAIHGPPVPHGNIKRSVYPTVPRPHLGYALQANAATLVRVLRHVLYEERLRQLNLISLVRRRLRADLQDFQK